MGAERSGQSSSNSEKNKLWEAYKNVDKLGTGIGGLLVLAGISAGTVVVAIFGTQWGLSELAEKGYKTAKNKIKGQK